MSIHNSLKAVKFFRQDSTNRITDYHRQQYTTDHIVDYHVPQLLKIIIEKRHDNNNNNNHNKNQSLTNLSKLKLHLDPQVLNYQVLQTLIVKGFQIEWFAIFCFVFRYNFFEIIKFLLTKKKFIFFIIFFQ